MDWHEQGASAQSVALDAALVGVTIPAVNIGAALGNLRNEVLGLSPVAKR
jgi:hypothetical protein